MSAYQFDELAKAIATPTSRRRALMVAAGGMLAGMFGLGRAQPASAACSGPTNAPCGAGTTPCGPCCCKAGIACVNAATGTCGCPAGTGRCGTTCCAAGVACANPTTSSCRGAAAACLNGGTPCGTGCCAPGTACNNGVCGGACNASECPGGTDINCGELPCCGCVGTAEGGFACIARVCGTTCSSSTQCGAGAVCAVIGGNGCCDDSVNHCAPLCASITICPD